MKMTGFRLGHTEHIAGAQKLHMVKGTTHQLSSAPKKSARTRAVCVAMPAMT